MKGQLTRILVAVVAMGACLALAQDKDKDHEKKHTNHIIVKAKTAANARPFYHPKKRYSDATWEAKIKTAQARRHHKPTPWWKAKPRATKHTTPWWKAHPKHKKRRVIIVVPRRHDNGKHLGWYKGKGNPHRRR